MHDLQRPYRTLLERLYGDDEVDLIAWVDGHPEEVAWLEELRDRPGDPVPPASRGDLWRLYALSRVLELLNFANQPGNPTKWQGPGILPEQVDEFVHQLGLASYRRVVFDPFDHEIVEVEPGDAEVRVTEVLWPQLMLGPLLIQRAGVRVAVSSGTLDPETASGSPLYWAYRRKLRRTVDLSQGWGSNSQWRTDFRRDYRLDGVRYFNVDGDVDLRSPLPGPGSEDAMRNPGLTRRERIESLIHRCQLHPPIGERWPYDDRFEIAEQVRLVGTRYNEDS